MSVQEKSGEGICKSCDTLMHCIIIIVFHCTVGIGYRYHELTSLAEVLTLQTLFTCPHMNHFL